jgi:hypothetical protein
MTDEMERIADAQERQAEALELIAGMLMLEYDSREDRPSYSAEALEEEARFHASGGDGPFL